MLGQIQECGCIALPEALQELTELYPGATYNIEVMPEGKGLVLFPVKTKSSEDIELGTHCS
jgi:hypothetical protein